MTSDSEQTLFIALRHPLRREILRAMTGHEKIAPVQVADLLGAPFSNIHYHFRVLSEHEAIELVDTQPVRGVTRYHYRMIITEPWALMVLDHPEDGGEDDHSEDE
jgi:DNA-binding transcriptional ArsR family regulator